MHLTTHSHYSFLEGLASPSALVKAASQQGMTALGMADRLRLTGVIEFYDACMEADIKPLLGLTLPLKLGEERVEVSLLAQDLAGWGNLCRLSSALLAEGAFELSAALTISELQKHNEGLLCLTGGQHSLLLNDAEDRLDSFLEIFPERLYVQLDHAAHWGGQMQRFGELAQRIDCPMVASSSVFYLEDSEVQLQKLFSAMRLNTTLNAVPEAEVAPPGAHFHSQSQMQAAYKDYPEALDIIAEVVERCNVQLPLGEQRYPDLHDLPEGQTSVDVLRKAAYTGAQQRYGNLNKDIEKRLEHELEVIESQGYATLFLIMADIVAHANQADVPTGSRGSASSSLVAHCLGITSPDPVRLNLYFERFLNPARRSPPDIDTDISSNRRDRLLHYVYERYGHERVAMVSTISRFRRRSALREVAKAHGLSSAEIKELVSGLPRRGWGPPGRGNRDKAPYEDMRAQFSSRYEPIFDAAERILGIPRHQSVHPGGMVISPEPMHELVPTQMASKGMLTTQFDLDSVARTGLVKIDLLGIRGLAVLGTLADNLYAKGLSLHKRQLDFLADIPMEDERTSQTVQAAETIGCFQIESPGMRNVLQEVDARSVDDIMVALALFRPGPITGGLKDAFVRRHLGTEQVRHLHPTLEPLLEDTYGVILYQEQVLRIAHELAGLSLAEADLLRRAMSHFDPGKQMQTLKEKFIEGAKLLNNVPASTGERIWDLMAAFAGYGFPKAHAAAYAEVAWRSAWCKTYYPAEFMAAVMANWGGYYRQRDYIAEAQRLGFAVRPPHINHSQRQFCVVEQDGEPVLYMGLNQVHSLTRRMQKAILAQRPFTNLEDFLTRSNPRLQEARNLIKVGGLAGLGTIPNLLTKVEGKQWRQGQPSLFGELADTEQEDWTDEQKGRAQMELLGALLVEELPDQFPDG